MWPRLNNIFVSQALGVPPLGTPPEREYAGVSTDSRKIAPGELFVALKGPSFDGHDYVEAALAAGAAGAVVERGFSLPSGRACLYPVEDTLYALGELGRSWRRAFPVMVAAVTGSNGKTTTKEILASILGRRREVLATQGNLNNAIGLPLTLLGLAERHEMAVVEMGMNATGEIARLTEIAQPDVGLVTNVGPAHLGPLGSMEAVAEAKTELFRGLPPGGTAVVNLDDPLLAPWAQRFLGPVVTFGQDAQAEMRATDVSALGSRQAFTLVPPRGQALRVRLGVPGRHNVMNAVAAAAAAWALGMGRFAILEGIEYFQPVQGRLTQRWGPGGRVILDDTYNANPASLAAGLAALKDVAGARRMVLVLGDMGELGPSAPELHRRCGHLAAEAGCAAVLALGSHAAQVVEGAVEGGLPAGWARGFTDFIDLIEAADDYLCEHDVILVKGSRSMRMERVVDALTTGEVA